jgi:hypothetical protein
MLDAAANPAAARRVYFLNLLSACASAIGGVVAWRMSGEAETAYPDAWYAASIVGECVALICTSKAMQAWRILRDEPNDATAAPRESESPAPLAATPRPSPQLSAAYAWFRNKVRRVSAWLGGFWSALLGGFLACSSVENIDDALRGMSPPGLALSSLCLVVGVMLLWDGVVLMFERLRFGRKKIGVHGHARFAEASEAHAAARGNAGKSSVHDQTFSD